MRLLAEIDDHSLGLSVAPHASPEGYVERRAARAVIFNRHGEIALLNARNGGYHKLPGGGIEAGESRENAVVREAMEETGCLVSLRPQVVGEIVEWRARFRQKQVSCCGIADVGGDIGQTALEQDEIAAGLALEWMTLDKAIAIMAADSPDEYAGKFIRERDLIFLKEVRRINVSASANEDAHD